MKYFFPQCAFRAELRWYAPARTAEQGRYPSKGRERNEDVDRNFQNDDTVSWSKSEWKGRRCIAIACTALLLSSRIDKQS